MKVGADETGTFSLVSAPGGLPSLTSKGAAVLYSVSGDTLTGYVEAGGGGGYQAASDRAVFTLQITSGGHYKFTLLDQLDHLPNSPANNDSQALSLNFASAIKFTDSDGDAITLSGGLNITVEDDIPVLTRASISRTVDEDDIRHGLVAGDQSKRRQRRWIADRRFDRRGDCYGNARRAGFRGR